MSDDPLAAALGMPPAQYAETSGHVTVVEETDKKADYKFARENLYELAIKGSDVLGHLVDLVKNSQDPEFVNSFSKLLDVTAKTNINLAKLSQIFPEGSEVKDAPHNVTNNNTIVFKGNQKDFIKSIKQQIAEAEREIDDAEIINNESTG